ncbi:hypothetical protein [Oenococcus oeni]|nr:hypothetical protein [Oenococcus oeni]
MDSEYLKTFVTLAKEKKLYTGSGFALHFAIIDNKENSKNRKAIRR